MQDPTTAGERLAVASTCAVRLEMRMPVDRGGRIAYQGGEGPFGFRPAELERAIEELGRLSA